MPIIELKARHDTLASPLGWLLESLAPATAAHPAIGLRLLTAERPRLHLLAFVLAMAAEPLSAEAVDHALAMPMREVLAEQGFSQLRGLRRLLGRIPGRILEPQAYRLLADLLVDPTAASVLHHMTEVTAPLLRNIQALPGPLRSSVVVDAIAHIEGGASHLLLWTEVVSRRLQTRSPDQIQGRLGRCRSVAELRAELEKLLDSLPALETAPPQIIQAGLRIDTPSAIRRLGKRFHNCLASYVDAEVDGTIHIYHWRRGETEAVCEVARAGNLGWFLGNHLGPENTPLPDGVARDIVGAFAAAGIPPLKVIETYDDLYFSTGGRLTAFGSDTGRPPRATRRGRYHVD